MNDKLRLVFSLVVYLVFLMSQYFFVSIGYKCLLRSLLSVQIHGQNYMGIQACYS